MFLNHYLLQCEKITGVIFSYGETSIPGQSPTIFLFILTFWIPSRPDPDDGGTFKTVYHNNMIVLHDLHSCKLLVLNSTFDYGGAFRSVLFSQQKSSLDPDSLYGKTTADFNIVVFQPPETEILVSKPGPVRSNSQSLSSEQVNWPPFRLLGQSQNKVETFLKQTMLLGFLWLFEMKTFSKSFRQIDAKFFWLS